MVKVNEAATKQKQLKKKKSMLFFTAVLKTTDILHRQQSITFSTKRRTIAMLHGMDDGDKRWTRNKEMNWCKCSRRRWCAWDGEKLRSEDVTLSIPTPATHKLSMNAERTHKLPLNTDRTHKLPMNIDRRTSNSTYEYWHNAQKYLWTLTKHTKVPMDTDGTYKNTYEHW